MIVQYKLLWKKRRHSGLLLAKGRRQPDNEVLDGAAQAAR